MPSIVLLCIFPKHTYQRHLWSCSASSLTILIRAIYCLVLHLPWPYLSTPSIVLDHTYQCHLLSCSASSPDRTPRDPVSFSSAESVSVLDSTRCGRTPSPSLPNYTESGKYGRPYYPRRSRNVGRPNPRKGYSRCCDYTVLHLTPPA